MTFSPASSPRGNGQTGSAGLSALLAGVSLLLGLWGLGRDVALGCGVLAVAFVQLALVARQFRRHRRDATHPAPDAAGQWSARGAWLDTVVRSAPIIISLKDAGGRIVLMNPEASRFHGIPLEEMIGKTDYDLYPKEQADRICAQDRQIMASDVTQTFEDSFVGLDGKHRCVMKRKTRVALPDGSLGVLTCLYDITQRKEAEVQAAQSRLFLASILDVVTHGVFVKDARHRWLLVNESFAKMVGVPPEDIIGKTDTDFVLQSDAEATWKQDDQVLSSGESLIFEQLTRLKDGREIWYEKHKSLLVTPEGERCVVGTIRDITEIKRVVLALRESEAHWTAVVETAHDGIVIIDEKGVILTANNAIHRMFGYQPGELINMNVNVLMPAPYRALHDGYMAHNIDAGVRKVVGVSRKVDGQRKDGSIVAIGLSVSEIQLGGRRVFTGFVRDRSEVVRQADISAQTEIVARVGGWEVDFATNELYWTAETYRIHEVTPETYHPTVETAVQFYIPEHRPLIAAAVEAAMREGTRWDLNLQIQTARGLKVWVRAVGEVVRRDDRVIKAFGAIQDITVQHAIEGELRMHHDRLQELVEARTVDLMKAKETAERANRAKSEFLSNMSHELRTPMHAVLSFARLGKERLQGSPPSPQKLERYFDRIDQSGTRLMALLNELLDLSKLEAGMMQYAFKQQDIRECIEHVIAEMSGLAKSRELRVEVQVRTMDPVAWFDELRIEQVLRNLLSNAIKFTSSGKTITISIEEAFLAGFPHKSESEAVPGLEICVSDQGVGIPEDELDAIFDEFVQSSKTKSGAGGTGLGLAIARRIVEQHGGYIEAANNAGGGARFIFGIRKTPMTPQGQQPMQAEAQV